MLVATPFAELQVALQRRHYWQKQFMGFSLKIQKEKEGVLRLAVGTVHLLMFLFFYQLIN